MEIILTNASKLLRVCFLLGLVLSSSSASSKERDTGSQANLKWTSLVDEVKEMMSNQSVCQMERYFCEVPLSREDSRGHFDKKCDCSDQCMTYGGCCSDKAARQAKYGVKAESEKYMCGYLQLPAGKDQPTALMVRNCHETFVGTNMENLCYKQPSDVLYDPLLELPVISFKTNVTYLNYYCAQCNNDAMNLVPMAYKMECETMSGSRVRPTSIYSLQFPSAKDYTMGEIPAPEHCLISEMQQEDLRNSRCWRNEDYVKTIPRNGKQKIFGNSADFSHSCIIKKIKYQHFRYLRKNYETSPCSYPSKLGQIHECNATWENKEDFEKCRSYSLTASINNTEYKNPHCAKCNFEDMTWLSVNCQFVVNVYARPIIRYSQLCAEDWVYDSDMEDCVLKLW